MADTLKTQEKAVKKSKEIIQEIAKLEGQDLKVLQAQVGTIKTELDELKEEWNEYKKPIADELQNEKQGIADKRVEYQYKIDKIKDLKKDVKQTIEDLQHKKDMVVHLEAQWVKMPKDINRNEYLKRIYDIIQNQKSQKVEIKNILQEIQVIKKETDQLVQDVKKIDKDLEEYIFNEAKKDKIAKELYKEVDTLKENFDVLITNVQEQSKLKSNMKEVETKTDDFRIKYKNGVEIEKLVSDLAEIKQENQYLSEKAKV